MARTKWSLSGVCVVWCGGREEWTAELVSSPWSLPPSSSLLSTEHTAGIASAVNLLHGGRQGGVMVGGRGDGGRWEGEREMEREGDREEGAEESGLNG